MDGTLNRDEVKQGYEKYFDRELSNEEISLIFKHVDAGKFFPNYAESMVYFTMFLLERFLISRTSQTALAS